MASFGLLDGIFDISTDGYDINCLSVSPSISYSCGKIVAVLYNTSNESTAFFLKGFSPVIHSYTVTPIENKSVLISMFFLKFLNCSGGAYHGVFGPIANSVIVNDFILSTLTIPKSIK